jgi:hypothetical protein
MTNNDQLDYLCGIYGFLQLSMRDVGLVDAGGHVMKRKKRKASESDGVALYEWVSDQLKHIPVHSLRKRASIMDARVKKLFNDNKTVNNFLLGMLLLRLLIDDSGRMEQLMILPKINRVINLVDEAISDEEFSVDIKRTTARVADNLYRQYTGRAQLTDEIRNAKFKRIVG